MVQKLPNCGGGEYQKRDTNDDLLKPRDQWRDTIQRDTDFEEVSLDFSEEEPEAPE